MLLSITYSEMSRQLYYSCVTFGLCFSQQHLRKWMEVVVLTHKGGQRSDGSVSVNQFPFACIRVQQGWVSLFLEVGADSLGLYCDFHIFPNADIFLLAIFCFRLSLCSQHRHTVLAVLCFKRVLAEAWVECTTPQCSAPEQLAHIWGASGHITIND